MFVSPLCFFLVILEHQMEILHLGNCVQNSKHITRNIWKSLADYSLPVLDHICYEENLLICIMVQFSQNFFFFFLATGRFNLLTSAALCVFTTLDSVRLNQRNFIWCQSAQITDISPKCRNVVKHKSGHVIAKLNGFKGENEAHKCF